MGFFIILKIAPAREKPARAQNIFYIVITKLETLLFLSFCARALPDALANGENAVKNPPFLPVILRRSRRIPLFSLSF